MRGALTWHTRARSVHAFQKGDAPSWHDAFNGSTRGRLLLARSLYGDEKAMSDFRFRVSDVYDVPLRGKVLRLKVIEGKPSLKSLQPGARLRLHSVSGREQVIPILDHAITGGVQSQARLDATGELDVVVAFADAEIDGEPVEIGWTATAA